MNQSIVFITRAAVVALALPAGAVQAQAVCYREDLFPDERIVIDVEPQGLLVTPWYDLSALVFGGKQSAYRVHGKNVFAERTEDSGWVYSVAAATGTVDVSTRYLLKNNDPAMQQTATGAHMGLVAHWVRGDGQPEGALVGLPVTWDCGSAETSTTPETWTCQSYNQFGVYWGTSILTKVAKPADDERCNLFESVPAVYVDTAGEVSNLGHRTQGSMFKR